MKQVWFGNGIHHHYSTDKFTPAFSRSFLEERIAALPANAAPAVDNLALCIVFGIVRRTVEVFHYFLDGLAVEAADFVGGFADFSVGAAVDACVEAV